MHSRCAFNKHLLLRGSTMLIALLATLNFIPRTLMSPISPSAYRLILNHGFSTNWFKTAEPLSKYNDRNIEDISLKGFTNVRLRSRADLYSPPYSTIPLISAIF